MHNCETVLNNLYEYINSHDIKPETSEELKRHLDECRQCFTLYEFEVRIVERFKEAGQCSCPDSLKEKIQSILSNF